MKFQEGDCRKTVVAFGPPVLFVAFLLTLSGPGNTEELVPPLEWPYISISLRSPERAQEISEYVFGTILRPDLAEMIRTEVVDEDLAESLVGLNCAEPVGYLGVMRLPPWQPAIEISSELEMPTEAAEATNNDEPVIQASVEMVNENGDIIVVQEIVADPEPSDVNDLEDVLEQCTWVVHGTATDWDAARKLLDAAMTPDTHLSPAVGRDDLFVAREGEDREVAFAVRTAGQQWYLCDGDDSLLLDQIANLDTSPARLAARNDALFTFRLEQLPHRVRRTFSEALWRQAAPGLQQRDDEPLDDFALREAMSRTLIELIDHGVTGLDAVSLGVDILEDEGQARTWIDVAAAKESDLAERLSELSGPQSMFLPLHDPNSALSFSLSINLTEFEQLCLTRWVRWYRAAIDAADPNDFEPAWRDPLAAMVDAIEATIATGHIDLFVQWEVEGPYEFGVLGGLKLAQIGSFRAGLHECADLVLAEINETDGTSDTSIHSSASHGVRLRQLKIKQSFDFEGPDGEPCDFDGCAGVGRGALWFAGGTYDSLARMQAAFDQMEAAAHDSEPPRIAPPLLLTARALEWQKLPTGDGFDAKLQRSLAEEAFASDDEFRVELRPTKNGMRLEAVAEEGFLKWIALMIATEHDEGEL